ncbi:preprotein translocase subunit YajC [Paenarthrobacter sp. Z7-10]|uniref:preprotein translocase subunit YajC n=1 Tax=Paenarthrobacter sp. Z7-10 TaxID=2787635 RepID=UPI0022A8F51F|nr:preprotein translocase subunit YajC [Paenarthrobacter sp. Z7-10]MCZ2404480.1 preprotein translocase subunit YajC [Paenarthrobacter sp. Z7-10]
MTLILFAVFAVFIIMMFRRQKKAKAAMQEQQAKMGIGVSVMTNFGLFGTVLAIDEQENKVVLQLSPGNTATVHRQTITKIIGAEEVTGGATASTIPDDASSLTNRTDSSAAPETAEDTILRLNKDNNNDH